MTKDEFMDFFRGESYDDLTREECVEIFLTSLKGSYDITPTLLKELLAEYEVSNISVNYKRKKRITK
jgi:hypothetical protein